MTNEKTESEIFEEQLKSLHRPLKQDQQKATESGNNQGLEKLETNQNLANNEVLANHQALAKESVKDLEAEPSYLSTGIAYLDNKIKDRSITAFDYYMAKKFLGLDLNVNLNGNLNLKTENKTRLASINKATQDIFDDIKALDLGNDLIQKAQEHSGLINQIKLWINHKTRGLKGVDYDLAKMDVAKNTYSNRVAKINAQGGPLTQKMRDQAAEMVNFGARSKEENTARISQMQEMLLNSLKKNMQMLESLGGNVSPLVLTKMNEYQDKADYIKETSGKIDLKKYKSLAGGES
nr:Coiled-coil domain-containing protein [Helicobacter pylori]